MAASQPHTYRLITLGCKVNQYETQVVREQLEARGLRPAADGENADFAVVNTCAVTAEASRKSRQMIRRAGRDGASVVAMGCDAGAEGDRLRAIPGVAGVFGHDRDIAAGLAEILDEAPTHLPVLGTAAPTATPQLVPLTTRISSFNGPRRAFLKIQDGCDAMCTYCIIPQLRTDLRSKPIDTAVEEARALVAAGHREITITGIFLGAYGHETALRRRRPDRPSPLAELVERVALIPGLERLRLSSLEPGDLDDTLLGVLADHACCVPHLHLPLQAGSSRILKRMNRQYTAADFRDMVDRVRATLDRPAISTDILVGFPGETDADFAESVAMAEYAGFTKIHAFPFSPREHTAAARWTAERVPGELVRERMARLAEVEHRNDLEFRLDFVGDIVGVFVERRDLSGNLCVGLAERYFAVHFEDTLDPGSTARVRIDRVTPRRTHGTRVV